MGLIIFTNFSVIFLYFKNYLKNKGTIIDERILYLWLSIVSSILYTWIYFRYGFNIDFVFLIFLTSILILIMFVDLMEMHIPDSLLLWINGIIIIYHILNYLLHHIRPNILFYLSGALVGGLIFLFILLVSRGGMGEGDLLLIASLGLVLGPYLVLLNILLSFVLGSLISIFLLLTEIKNQKDPIPFGPFIIIAFFISLLFGENIINWYLNILIT